MTLITDEIRPLLIRNGQAPWIDHLPVVRFDYPGDEATWLISEIDREDPDILFGLVDYGLGCPGYGSIRLTELRSFKNPLGLGVRRNTTFQPRHPISIYVVAAREAGAITTDAATLDRIAWLHGLLPPPTGSAAWQHANLTMGRDS